MKKLSFAKLNEFFAAIAAKEALSRLAKNDNKS